MHKTDQEKILASYVLPIRRTSLDAPDSEFTAYIARLSKLVDLLIVDNSDPTIFAINDECWGDIARHVAPDKTLRVPNQKVGNVLTGARLASHDTLIIADDDVRWSAKDLRRALKLLLQADLVCPQNYFDPMPWQAKWDTARTLINRAASHDYPGTLVVNRAHLMAASAYDGAALFENLELMRAIEAICGRILYAQDLFVARRPASIAKFWSQRVRYAYEEFATPRRMAVWLTLLPFAALMALVSVPGLLGVIIFGTLLAELGRQRSNGRSVFPVSVLLFVPIWLLERSISAWLALCSRIIWGGVKYNGLVMARAAYSLRELQDTNKAHE